MTDVSAPFPESELKALAFWHDQAAATWKTDSRMQTDHLRRAKACRDALAAHVELRERCLVAEMELGQARRAS